MDPHRVVLAAVQKVQTSVDRADPAAAHGVVEADRTANLAAPALVLEAVGNRAANQAGSIRHDS
jgi:hypothetical protein